MNVSPGASASSACDGHISACHATCSVFLRTATAIDVSINRASASLFCGDPRAAGDREDPHAPGVSGQGAATLSYPQGFSGPMNAARRQGVTRRRYPRKTLFACAINAQQNSAASKDRFKRIGRRVQPCWGCQGKEIGRLKILSSDVIGVIKERAQTAV